MTMPVTPHTKVADTSSSGIHPTELYAAPMVFNLNQFSQTIKSDLAQARADYAQTGGQGASTQEKAKHTELGKTIKALEAAQKIINKYTTQFPGVTAAPPTNTAESFNQRVLGLPIGMNPANPFIEIADLKQALQNFSAQVKGAEQGFPTPTATILKAEKSLAKDLDKAVADIK